MSYQPKHSEFDPFPMFITEEMNYYVKRGRLLHGTLKLDFLRSVGQLLGKRQNRLLSRESLRRILSRRIMTMIPRISPRNLQDVTADDR